MNLPGFRSSSRSAGRQREGRRCNIEARCKQKMSAAHGHASEKVPRPWIIAVQSLEAVVMPAAYALSGEAAIVASAGAAAAGPLVAYCMACVHGDIIGAQKDQIMQDAAIRELLRQLTPQTCPCLSVCRFECRRVSQMAALALSLQTVCHDYQVHDGVSSRFIPGVSCGGHGHLRLTPSPSALFQRC
jgi:hypothetical protein